MTLVYGPLIGGEGSPIGKTYMSVTVSEDGVERSLVPGTRIRLTIRKDGVLIVRAGCNELSGGITLDGGVLGFREGVRTQMGCGPEREAQDDWLMEFIMRQPEWTVDGDTLILTSGGMTLVLLDRVLAEPDLPLDGTTWTLGPATLTINGTQATGSTGSSRFTATVMRDNATLTCTDLTVTPTHPRGRAAELEQAVVETLRTPLTYAIESNHLELRGPTRTLKLTAVLPEGTPDYSG